MHYELKIQSRPTDVLAVNNKLVVHNFLFQTNLPVFNHIEKVRHFGANFLTHVPITKNYSTRQLFRNKMSTNVTGFQALTFSSNQTKTSDKILYKTI